MIFAFRGGVWDFADDRARVVGIVNVTPDSFSDGGLYSDPSRAIERALELAGEGADAIDLGAQSTRPGSKSPVGADEEWQRLEPVIAPLAARLAPRGIPLSVDTCDASVARRALDAGASIVNDVSGLMADSEMAAVAAAAGAGLVIMHSLGAPASASMHAPREYDDVGGEIGAFLAARVAEAVAAGVAPEAIALDPGIGFSKRAGQSVAALRALPRLTALGRPLYIGVSRKSFLGRLTGRPVAERLFAGLGATVAAVALGARIVRTHDVAATRDALLAAEAILGTRSSDIAEVVVDAGPAPEPEPSRA